MSVWHYSVTAGDNSGGATTPGISVGEGCAPSSLNDGMRKMMADTAELVKLLSAQYTTAGTANAQTVSPSPSWGAYANGQRALLKIGTGLTNSGSATLNFSSLGAKTVYRMDGASTLSAGDLPEGGVVEVIYDSAINGFRLLTNSGNFGTLAVSGNATVGGTLGVTGVASFADGTVSSPSITNTGDTNTGIYFPAADEVGITAGGNLAGLFRVVDTNTGGLLLGQTSTITTPAHGGVPRLQVAGAGNHAVATFLQYGAGGGGPGIDIGLSRNTSIGSHTIVQSGDRVAVINGYGSDGTALRSVASIYMEVDGTPGSSDMPGRILFLVTPDGSATAAEALRISNDKTIYWNGTGNTLVDSSGNIPAARLSTNIVSALPSGSCVKRGYAELVTATTKTDVCAPGTTPTTSNTGSILTLAHTPRASGNKVVITATVVADSDNLVILGAIFAGSTLLRSAATDTYDLGQGPVTLTFSLEYTFASSAEVTFDLRIAANSSGTIYVNRNSAGASNNYGGSLVTSISILEFKP